MMRVAWVISADEFSKLSPADQAARVAALREALITEHGAGALAATYTSDGGVSYIFTTSIAGGNVGEAEQG